MRVASLTKTSGEIIDELGSLNVLPEMVRVAYHAPSLLRPKSTRFQNACSNRRVWVMPVKEKHFCCGSAGIYNLVQPEIVDILKGTSPDTPRHARRFVATETRPPASAQSGLETPVVHMIELLDWALGGSKPPLIK